jgi:hypothetical protein
MSEKNTSPRDSGRRQVRLGLGLAVVALAAFLVARRLRAPRRMPHAAIWRRVLAEKHGDAEADRLLARAQARYDELYAERPRPPSRALRLHIERSILPGLALYQTLLEESDDRDAVLSQMESLMAPSLAGLRWLLPLLGRLPDPFAAFRRIVPGVVRFAFPPEGWGIEPVEDSEDCIAFDIRRCIYLDTLTSYGAPELTPLYCAGDDDMFEALPPSITWERTMTLGRGDDHCDFRWCRGPSEGTAPAVDQSPGG